LVVGDIKLSVGPALPHRDEESALKSTSLSSLP
jgi:hypothetical protein